MLYQVPSGSKSSASGCATGCAFWNELRSATRIGLPVALRRKTPFTVLSTPCEQPLPAVSTYIVPPIQSMSAGPLVRLPVAAVVWLDGKRSVTVVRTPLLSTLEMRPPRRAPLYGPSGG